jgi:DNA-binding NtrC family response regulator
MRRKQILAVDDEPLILRSVEKALTAAGHSVTAVGSGPEARALLKDHRYDCVVTDIAMEGFNGLEVLRAAKEADPDVCVVVVTGYCDVSTAIEALRLGAEDYLSKPFDFDELLLRVASCLDKRELRRKLHFYEKMLPVCAGCKKIRDDAGREPGTGEWMPLEEYLSRAAGVTCSHGYCPSCAERFGHR